MHLSSFQGKSLSRHSRWLKLAPQIWSLLKLNKWWKNDTSWLRRKSVIWSLAFWTSVWAQPPDPSLHHHGQWPQMIYYTLSHFDVYLSQTVTLPITHHYLSHAVISPLSWSFILFEHPNKFLSVAVPLSAKAMPNSLAFCLSLITKIVGSIDLRQIVVLKGGTRWFYCFVFYLA